MILFFILGFLFACQLACLIFIVVNLFRHYFEKADADKRLKESNDKIDELLDDLNRHIEEMKEILREQGMDIE